MIEPRTRRSFVKFTLGVLKLTSLFEFEFITDCEVALYGVDIFISYPSSIDKDEAPLPVPTLKSILEPVVILFLIVKFFVASKSESL